MVVSNLTIQKRYIDFSNIFYVEKLFFPIHIAYKSIVIWKSIESAFSKLEKIIRGMLGSDNLFYGRAINYRNKLLLYDTIYIPKTEKDIAVAFWLNPKVGELCAATMFEYYNKKPRGNPIIVKIPNNIEIISSKPWWYPTGIHGRREYNVDKILARITHITCLYNLKNKIKESY